MLNQANYAQFKIRTCFFHIIIWNFLCIFFPPRIIIPSQNVSITHALRPSDASQHRVGSSNFGPSPLSSRHGSQESLRHLNTMGSMSMLQTPTSSVRDSVTAAQKKKSIKSSLGRLFSKKEKVTFDATVKL